MENLVGYAKRDLVIPGDPLASLAERNAAAVSWCAEVNGRMHSEIMAVPAERLIAERSALRPLPSLRPPVRAGEARKVDRLATIRFGSARYSVPHALVGRKVEVAAVDGEIVLTHQGSEVARHLAVTPGEASILDAHYGGARSRPARAVRAKTAPERAFLALGPAAEAFLRAAAAAGTARLASELAEIASLEAAFGRERLIAAIERATAFRRFRASDVSIDPRRRRGRDDRRGARRAARARVARRPGATALGVRDHVSAAGAELAADLERGLKRLKLRAIRRMAPEVLQSAKIQRWSPEELLRTLVEAEIGARDEANLAARLRAAAFPVRKSLEEFKVAESAVPQATFDYLASLEWIRAKENLVLVGPAGTGKSHLLVALGHAAVASGLRVRYFSAIDLVEALYRGLADNSVGKILDALVRSDLLICDELGFAPLDLTGGQLFFRVVAAAYERKSLAIASHWPFEEWGRFFPETVTTTSLLDRVLHHATVVVTSGESFRMKEARSRSAPRVRAIEAATARKSAKATR